MTNGGDAAKEYPTQAHSQCYFVSVPFDGRSLSCGRSGGLPRPDLVNLPFFNYGVVKALFESGLAFQIAEKFAIFGGTRLTPYSAPLEMQID